MSRKITENFSFWEFAPNSVKDKKSWMPDSEYQNEMVCTLARNLQIIRSLLPPKCQMSIISGMRHPDDFIRLKKQGYNPSETSDHNFGYSVGLTKGGDKFKRFGPTYNFSVGAADVSPKGISAWDLFKLSIDAVNGKKCTFGQVIYEKNPKSGSEWVHYGNDPAAFFSPWVVILMRRNRFMTSTDNGKTYNIIQPLR
jgi:hypothetical protein